MKENTLIPPKYNHKNTLIPQKYVINTTLIPRDSLHLFHIYDVFGNYFELISNCGAGMPSAL